MVALRARARIETLCLPMEITNSYVALRARARIETLISILFPDHFMLPSARGHELKLCNLVRQALSDGCPPREGTN